MTVGVTAGWRGGEGSLSVMAALVALVAAIHAFVDARDKPGRDEWGYQGGAECSGLVAARAGTCCGRSAFVDARDEPGRDEGAVARHERSLFVMAALVAAMHACVDAREGPGVTVA